MFVILQRVLSVVWSKGKLGSAYYDTETSQIYLQMDVVETKDFQFLKRGKLTVINTCHWRLPNGSRTCWYKFTILIGKHIRTAKPDQAGSSNCVGYS